MSNTVCIYRNRCDYNKVWWSGLRGGFPPENSKLFGELG